MGTLANLGGGRPAKRRRWLRLLLWLGGIVGVAIVGIVAGYYFDVVTESAEFCGALCHPNRPQYATHQVSAHANVECGICHVGPGLLPKVEAKVRGMKELYLLATNSYERPIAAPVESLLSTERMCEHCHWPGKSYPAQVRGYSTFAEDRANSEMRTELEVFVGDQDAPTGGIGAHWHIANEVEYISRDAVHREIPWVSVAKGDRVTVYESVAGALSGEELESLPREQMDCVDCHNRATHVFQDPLDLLDEAMAEGRIDRNLPFVKREGAKLLTADYASREAGIEAVGALEQVYMTDYADVYASKQGAVQQAVAELREIQRRTLFPEMNVTADSYPDNLGHLDSSGCFRCHDGTHVSSDDQVISARCNLCHSLPEVTVAGKVLGQGQSLNVALRLQEAASGYVPEAPPIAHPVKATIDCLSCHSAGGVQDLPVSHQDFQSDVCQECHQVAAQVSVATNIPHPDDGLADCLECHDQGGGQPAPSSHVSWRQDTCLLCHESAAQLRDLAAIPHPVEGLANCLECHDASGGQPVPSSHVSWKPDTCLVCHEAASELRDLAAIPHPVEGMADCLKCHGQGKPMPAPTSHDGWQEEICLVCHEQG